MIKNKRKKEQFIVKKERRIRITLNFSFLLKFIAILIIIICVFFTLGFKHIVIYFNKENKYSSLFFTIMVSMTLLLFLVGFGIVVSAEKFCYKIPLLIFIIYMASVGMEYIGLGIIFNTHFGLLRYWIYESNSKKGILFFIYNLLLFFVIWLIHLPFITEVKE